MSPPNDRVPFSTPRFSVRYLTPEDAVYVQGVLSDPTLMRFLGGANPHSVEKHSSDITKNPGSMAMLGITELRHPNLIGLCGLISGKADSLKAEIWIVLTVASQGNGAGKEILQGLIDYAKCVLHLQRISATVHPSNIASRKLMATLGFERIGTQQGGKQDRYELYELSLNKN